MIPPYSAIFWRGSSLPCAAEVDEKQTLFLRILNHSSGFSGALKPSPPTAQPIPYLLCLPGVEGPNGIHMGSTGVTGWSGSNEQKQVQLHSLKLTANAPRNDGFQVRNLRISGGAPIFRGYDVSFREGKSTKTKGVTPQQFTQWTATITDTHPFAGIIWNTFGTHLEPQTSQNQKIHPMDCIYEHLQRGAN